MRLILEGNPEEIAALVLAVQERRGAEKESCAMTIDGEKVGTIRLDSHD